jgi:hypothetical protein
MRRVATRKISAPAARIDQCADDADWYAVMARGLDALEFLTLAERLTPGGSGGSATLRRFHSATHDNEPGQEGARQLLMTPVR